MKRQQVKHLVTVQEAAEMTSMSIGWWRGALAARKPMPPVRIIRIGRVVRLHYGDLVAWIDGGASAPTATRRPGRPTKAKQMARKRDAALQSKVLALHGHELAWLLDGLFLDQRDAHERLSYAAVVYKNGPFLKKILAKSICCDIFISMKTDVSTLPDSPDALKEIIVDLHGQIAGLQDVYDKETGILLEQIRHLRAQLFGRKSEKIRPEGGPQPLPLFDMPEPVVREEADEIQVPAHSRKKAGRKPLPAELPRVEVIHDIDAADKICGCGNELSRIGEEVSEQLDIIPAKVRVIRHIRPKYACRDCGGVDGGGPAVRIAPVPPQIIPKSIAGPGLLWPMS